MMSEKKNNSDHTSALIDQIVEAGRAATSGEQPGAREKLLNLSYALSASVELPSEAIQRMGWTEPAAFALCRIAVDLKLFELLTDASSSSQGREGLSATELAKASGADPILIARMMKHLAAVNVVAEIAEDRYAATSLSRALVEPKYRDGVAYTFDVAGPSFAAMPAYFKSIAYRHPTDIADGPFQHAHGTEAPFFAFLAQNPVHLARFNNYMAGYRAGKRSWIDPGFYPFVERIAAGFSSRQGNSDETGSGGSSSSSALLVDVGGGLGHDLLELRSKVPDLPAAGRLVLQDKADVISQIEATTAGGGTGFQATAHDFFTAQPERGARAYYLHSVLHDWSDDDCRRILRPLVEAMVPGYSRLLVNELVVPSVGAAAARSATSMDWLMMALGAVRERTESDWRALLQSVGLRVSGIWTYEQGTESLIEAEVA